MKYDPPPMDKRPMIPYTKLQTCPLVTKLAKMSKKYLKFSANQVFLVNLKVIQFFQDVLYETENTFAALVEQCSVPKKIFFR